MRQFIKSFSFVTLFTSYCTVVELAQNFANSSCNCNHIEKYVCQFILYIMDTYSTYYGVQIASTIIYIRKP